jgi:O-antigen/teichoic acid export membrane protein
MNSAPNPSPKGRNATDQTVSTSQVSVPAVLSEPTGGVRHEKPVLTQSLLTGAGALGVALGIERGGSFLSNLLAARLGGTAVFGAYSIALTTANNIASYAGAGIGYTATRFIAEHAPGTKGYNRVARQLTAVALTSALIAGVALWVGALPMAKLLLRNERLAGPLRIAALSSAAFVALECCRGVFLGTRNFGHLLALSTLVGTGLLIVVPAMSRLGPSYMLVGQACAILLAVAVSGFLILRPGLTQSPTLRDIETPSMAKVWRFGLIQLGGVAGLNAAGWWIATLVARGDPSLLQIAFYAVANQLRNVTSLLPSLVSQGNFAFFTEEGAAEHGGANTVVTVSTVMASLVATLLSGIVIVLLPGLLSLSYGKHYLNATLPSTFAVATVLIHLGNAPAASRLNIVSLRATGIVNGVWALVVVALGNKLVPIGGATAAVAALFSAHLISALLVVVALWRIGALPPGIGAIAGLNIAGALGFAWLAWMRAIHPNYAIGLNAVILAFAAGVSITLVRFAQNNGFLQRPLDFRYLLPTRLRGGKDKLVVASL